MPSATSLSINDGTVAKTYSKTIATGNSVVFTDTSAATTVGQPTLTVEFRPRSARQPTTKVVGRLAVPYEQTIDGELVVKHVSRGEFSFTIPDSVPASERTRLYSLVKNAIALATMSTSVTAPEAFY